MKEVLFHDDLLPKLIQYLDSRHTAFLMRIDKSLREKIDNLGSVPAGNHILRLIQVAYSRPVLNSTTTTKTVKTGERLYGLSVSDLTTNDQLQRTLLTVHQVIA